MATVATEPFRSAQFPVQNASVDDIKPSLLKTYNVSERDNKTYVTGCDLQPNGDFVIADQEVPYVKYYDNQGVLKKQINTESCGPWDACFIDNNTIAVSTLLSANNEHILFVNITDNKVIKKVHVGRGGKRLCFDKLLVVGKHSRSGLEIVFISLEGKIINRFQTNVTGEIFISNKLIYHTEWKKDAVVYYDESGNIKWRYQDPSLKDPRGIILDYRGFIFVVSHYNSSVIATSPDRQSSRTIVGPEQGLDKPYALAFDCDNRKLLVCNVQGGNVFLYQI